MMRDARFPCRVGANFHHWQVRLFGHVASNTSVTYSCLVARAFTDPVRSQLTYNRDLGNVRIAGT
jgi:hypothetical protein